MEIKMNWHIFFTKVMLIVLLSSSCNDDNINAGNKNERIKIQVTHPDLQYSGRWQINEHIASASATGSSVKIAFNGTGLSALLSSDNYDGDGFSYLYVIIDGDDSIDKRKVIRLNGIKQFYPVVSDLPMGHHTVEIVKKNEAWGVVHLHELQMIGNRVVGLEPRAERLIEFIGDSNPSGWSAWDDKDQGGDDATDGYYAYPGFTARGLDAEWVNLSVGGFGVTEGMGDKDLTDYHDKIHVYHQINENTWDFENNNLGRKPDVVVINLGANDYWNGAAKADIKSSWKKLLTTQIRPVYPNAHVVFANSIGWAINEPADYLDELTQELNAMGESNVSFVKFPWLWGQDHAIISEQAGFANILGAHIAEQMAWEWTPVSYSSIPLEKGRLGNASFEKNLLGPRPDGWRPINVDTNASYQTGSEAKDGNAFVRCKASDGVHQAVLAEEGDVFTISVWAKGEGIGLLQYRFRNQSQSVLIQATNEMEMTEDWQKIELTTQAAPAGTWQIDVVLQAADNAVVDFDATKIGLND
ncbi:GDSL-type esterase/lipase family protein [Carboxylicivirga sp. RSCT41]|uniref:GDSL-type esterase/lipase family protein n=1 Tax=Carboxylicivirga agarovorans TaxID=3417570 RepID=UPI003D3249A5